MQASYNHLSAKNTQAFKLAYNLPFSALYTHQGKNSLHTIDTLFLEQLKISNADLHDQLLNYRQLTQNNAQAIARDDKIFANFLTYLAPYVDDFLMKLFNLETSYLPLQQSYQALAIVYRIKRQWLQRLAGQVSKTSALTMDELNALTIKLKQAINQSMLHGLTIIELPELTQTNHLNLASQQEDVLVWQLCHAIEYWQQILQAFDKQNETGNIENLNQQTINQQTKERIEEALQLAQAYALQQLLKQSYSSCAGNRLVDVLFKLPQKIIGHGLNDLLHGLVNINDESNQNDENNQNNENDEKKITQTTSKTALKAIYWRQRTNSQTAQQAFSLTDEGFNTQQALAESHYCIHCHPQNKDSCAKGLLEKNHTEKQGTEKYKSSNHDIPLMGCPLEERISEFHLAKSQGHLMAALALIVIDNPMVAATGHRICNDCVKACIYQKQTPVDIPQAETHTLKTVLNLPYGFEIYSLLTRWNPLNVDRPLPKAPSGKKVLVVGLGPAGYTLAHHLMNDGHEVMAIDGLKIEPLNPDLLTAQAIDNIDEVVLKQDLHSRVAGGFGGVSEYGITVRWNKNFLTIIRLLLEKRQAFHYMGGIRFGSTLTPQQAFAMGFDHIALAIGAGKPTILDIKGSMAGGVRSASDFLMNLQLGQPQQQAHIHLDIALPIVVIGGGLTAIDAATESIAYYISFLQKFSQNRQQNLTQFNQQLTVLNSAQQEQVNTYLQHIEALNIEIAQANLENRPANFIQLIQQWGGVTLAYRKDFSKSPAFSLNHEEVQKALEEGIYLMDEVSPIEFKLDAFGQVTHVVFTQVNQVNQTQTQTQTITIPAKTVLVAAGTQPNTILAQEFNDFFSKDGKYFKTLGDSKNQNTLEKGYVKISQPEFFIYQHQDGRLISYLGDLHPNFAGNVVKAMASSKRAYPIITQALAQQTHTFANTDLMQAFKQQHLVTLKQINRLTPTIVELIFDAPMQAKNFEPGQFYRLQNYQANHQGIALEPIALTGAWVDADKNLLGCIILEVGGSTKLCQQLKLEEPLILMGPTGTPTHIAKQKTVLLIGGGLGNAVLFSIAKALKSNGCKVIYFAGYKQMQDRYKVEAIESYSDLVVWCCDEGILSKHRPQDISLHGNMLQALNAYVTSELSNLNPLLNTDFKADKVDEVIVIGSNGLMAATAYALKNTLKSYFKKDLKAVASINSPMQCMMKEICGQCIQAHTIDGKTEYVFSCVNQDQNLFTADFSMLAQRLGLNAISECLGR